MNFKNVLGLLIALFVLGVTTSVAQQDTINVTPGFGELEAAIEANGGDVVYKLEAGAWYGSQGIIEVNDTVLGGAGKTLVIVGEETDGMPPIIQVGNAADGSVFGNIFNVYSNITLKNLFLSAQDFDGITGAGIMTRNAPVRITIDNCVFDPVGINKLINGGQPSAGADLYFTNNLVLRNGHVLGPNDGGFFMGAVWDTIWIENNTFVSSGQDLIAAGGAGFHPEPRNNFIWINHNTFLWHDVWLKKTYNDNNVFVTNNLFHDVSIFAQLYAWGQFFPDYTPSGNRMLSLMATDTAYTTDGEGEVMEETLPSERKLFWEYNLQYNSPELQGIPKYAADNSYAGLYLIPMLWDDDVPATYASYPVESPADSSRENWILQDKTNFPNMHYGNNHYDIDPGYTDPVIYDMNDSLYANVINWYKTVIFQEEDVVPQAEAPSYNWDVDRWEGTPNNEFPVVWPRFDGTYTNSELLTASIEGLPLGDLNWFPEAKARWMSEQSQIMDHIVSLNENAYVITTDVEDVRLAGDISVYPNPATDILHISSPNALKNVSIFNVTGKKVMDVQYNSVLKRSLDISSLDKGVYIIRVSNTSDEVYSTRIVKQ